MTTLLERPEAPVAAPPPHERRRLLPQPVTGLKVAILAVLLVIVGLPLWQLVYGAFHTGDPFEPGSFTLENFTTLLDQTDLGRSAWNTLIFAGGSTVLALGIGIVIAWLVSRTDLPWARSFYAMTLAPILIPGLIGAVAWAVLLSERTGLINEYLLSPVLGFRFDVYSMPGMVAVQTLSMVPLVVILMAAAFRRVDPDIEHAARVSGASKARAFLLAVGVVRPAVLTSGLVVLVVGLESIEVPLIFGTPAQVSVLSGDIYRALRIESPTRWGPASATSLLLILVVLLLFVGYTLLTRNQHRYVTLTGRGRAGARIELGGMRWVAFLAVGAFQVLTLVLPTLAIVYASLIPFVGKPDLSKLADATWDNYRALSQNAVLTRAATNSFTLALVGGLIALALCLLIAVLGLRSPSRLSQVNDSFALIPLAIPRIALAPAFLWAFISLPFGLGRHLYGSLTIMAIAYVVMYLPIGTRQISSQLVQIAPELEHASRVCGAGPWRTVLRVTVPLLAPALTGAFFLAFVSFYREFSVSALLYQTGSEVFSVAMFGMILDGNTTGVAALSVVFILAVAAVLGTGFGLLRLATRYSRAGG